MIVYQGKSYDSLRALAKEYNVNPQTLYARLKNGWELNKALEIPVKEQNNVYQGKMCTSIKQLAEKLGIKYQTLYRRIYRGWSLADALSVPVRNK